MKTAIRNTKYPRRVRPQYPSIAPGDRVSIERTECGINYTLQDAKRSRPKAIVRRFSFCREVPPAPTSKYQPHVGKKEAAR